MHLTLNEHDDDDYDISLSIIGRLVGVLGGSEFLHCLVGWLGVTAVPSLPGPLLAYR